MSPEPRHNAPLLAGIFEASGWLLFGPEWVKDHLRRMSAGSYENSTAAVVAKLLLRNRTAESRANGAGDRNCLSAVKGDPI